jgi:hypothetical protein
VDQLNARQAHELVRRQMRARAAPVHEHDVLAQPCRHVRRQQAGHRVGAAAGRVGRIQAQRAGGKFRRAGSWRGQQQGGGAQRRPAGDWHDGSSVLPDGGAAAHGRKPHAVEVIRF